MKVVAKGQTDVLIEVHERLGRRKLRFALAMAVFLALTGCSEEATEATSLQGAFKEEFGVLPPIAVSNIRSKQIVIRDAAAAWLRFNADPATIDGILAKGFVPASHQQFVNETTSANKPTWWDPDSNNATIYFIHEKWRSDHITSVAVIAHDSKKQILYFNHSCSD